MISFIPFNSDTKTWNDNKPWRELDSDLGIGFDSHILITKDESSDEVPSLGNSELWPSTVIPWYFSVSSSFARLLSLPLSITLNQHRTVAVANVQDIWKNFISSSAKQQICVPGSVMRNVKKR